MTLHAGESSRNVFENSHASQTNKSELPVIPFVPVIGSFPPITAEGSAPAFIRTWVSIDVVVVLPWVPAIPIQLPNFLETAPRSFDRSNVGIPLFFAAINSGLSLIIAAV